MEKGSPSETLGGRQELKKNDNPLVLTIRLQSVETKWGLEPW